MFGTETGFEFDNKVYKTLSAATAQREEALKIYGIHMSTWDAHVEADKIIATRGFKKMELAFNDWMQKYDDEELPRI